jgi:hypothetical protein
VQFAVDILLDLGQAVAVGDRAENDPALGQQWNVAAQHADRVVQVFQNFGIHQDIKALICRRFRQKTRVRAAEVGTGVVQRGGMHINPNVVHAGAYHVLTERHSVAATKIENLWIGVEGASITGDPLQYEADLLGGGIDILWGQFLVQHHTYLLASVRVVCRNRPLRGVVPAFGRVANRQSTSS